MKFGKKQIILGVLLVALGSAVYLNWQFSDNSKLLSATSTENTAKELGKAQYANASATVTETGMDEKTSDTDAMVTDKSSLDYFKSSRESRDEAQEKIMELATEVLKSTESDDTARTEAVKSAAEIAAIIQKQSNIENLIKAKGFTECMAYIQNGECTVVVSKGKLTESTVISVKDIINSQTGIDFENINITEV